MSPFEQTSLVHLVQSDNKLVNKVVLALSAVCYEMNQLVDEARSQLYPPLLLYGSGGKESLLLVISMDGDYSGTSHVGAGYMHSIFHFTLHLCSI